MGLLGASALGFSIFVGSFLAQSDAVRPKLEDVRIQREQRLMRVREKVDQARDRVQSRRDELKERLSAVRDERKSQAVLRIADRFVSINERWTNHWYNVLDRLEDLLVKLEGRDDSARAAGEVQTAREAIRVARAAVDAQASKTYQVQFNDESTLRDDVSAIAAQFKADLRATRAQVKLAHEAVVAALRVYNSGNN